MDSCFRLFQHRTLTIAISLIAFCGLLLPNTSHAQVTNHVTFLKGAIVSATDKKPVTSGRVFVYQTANNEITHRSKINSDGSYALVLNQGKQYKFVLLSPLYHTTEVMVSIPDSGQYDEIERELIMQPIIKGETVFAGRLFAPNSSELTLTPALTKTVNQFKDDRAVIVTFDIKADGQFVKPVAAAPVVGKTKTKAPAKKKGGKKPTAEVAVVAATPQAVDSTQSPAVQIRVLGMRRVEALKQFFKAQGISLTQAVVQFDGSTVAATEPNVVGKVTNFDTDIDYENLEN